MYRPRPAVGGSRRPEVKLGKLEGEFGRSRKKEGEENFQVEKGNPGELGFRRPGNYVRTRR